MTNSFFCNLIYSYKKLEEEAVFVDFGSLKCQFYVTSIFYSKFLILKNLSKFIQKILRPLKKSIFSLLALYGFIVIVIYLQTFFFFWCKFKEKGNFYQRVVKVEWKILPSVSEISTHPLCIQQVPISSTFYANGAIPTVKQLLEQIQTGY